MNKRYLLITGILLITGMLAQAQYTRYIIQFTNKKGTPYTFSNPSAYLSAQAIARRARYQVSIDSTDLPIAPAYLDSILAVPNVTFLNLSKWMNQVCIKTSDNAAITKINTFPFVKNTSAIAPRISTPAIPIGDKVKDVITGDLQTDSVASPAGATNYYNYGNNLPQIHIHNGEYLHNLGFHGENMTIAVLDAGFYGWLTNPMFDSLRLNNQVLGTYDYVHLKTDVNTEDTHGMMCLSTIAANRPGIMTGTCPKAKFWLLKTEDPPSEYIVEEQNWLAAAEFADSAGADLISTSLGYSIFDDASFNHVYSDRNGHTSLVTRAANMAVSKGMIVTASAGNDGGRTDDYKYVACPGDGDNVFTVGATDVNGNVASFSCWGPNYAGGIKPNVVSVGKATVVSNTLGNASTGSGTSFSNPNMAGLVTCLWQAFPEATNLEIMNAVQKSAHKYDNPDGRYGYGIPDFKKAFSILLTQKFQGNVSTNGCATTLSWTSKDNNTLYYQIERKADNDTGFTKIATISGQSAAFQTNSYTWVDTMKSFSLGQVAYRLKEVFSTDTTLLLLSGSNTITEPCFSLLNEFTVSPNPFRSVVYLNINTSAPISHLGVELVDMKGSTVYQYSGVAASGKLNLRIPAGNLASGIYILTVRDGKKVLYSKKLLR